MEFISQCHLITRDSKLRRMWRYDERCMIKIQKAEYVCTCPPSCFIRGCNSLKRSYPWWKKVRWAYMKDSICGEDRDFTHTRANSWRGWCQSRRKRLEEVHLRISGFPIFFWIVGRWSTMNRQTGERNDTKSETGSLHEGNLEKDGGPFNGQQGES